MLQSILSTTGESFTLVNALIIMLASIVLGLVISSVYLFTHRKETNCYFCYHFTDWQQRCKSI